MDRERLMEIIDSNGRFNLPTVELELLADHLIANGIGDITAEKHRADVAEEALRGLLKKQIEQLEEDCPSTEWKTVIKDCDYKTKSHEDCTKCWTDFITQQAEARLKEQEGKSDEKTD